MRRLRPEVWISGVALMVSVLTLVSGTIWARGAARDDELRAERRTAFAEYIGVVSGCSRWYGTRSDADLDVAPAERVARVEEEVLACQSDVGAASSTVNMLSDDDDLLESMTALEERLLALWTIRFDIAAAADEAALAAPPPERAGIPCTTAARDDLIGEYVACQFGVESDQATFLVVARADVQADPPDLVDIAVRAAPWVVAFAALAGIGALIIRRRSPVDRMPTDHARADGSRSDDVDVSGA
jgi:hypothetical protein